jgi:predicted Zn-dependent protease
MKTMIRRGWIRRITVLAALGLLLACTTVPITGRQSLNIVPDSELLSMSLQQYGEVLKTSTLSKDPVRTQMVRNVGERIARATEEFFQENGMASETGKYRWEFNLIDDDKTVNAWCMPGGKVAFFTGILPIAQNETGVAVVMGHEVAHAIAKHGNERMSQGLLVQLGEAGLSAALSKNPGATIQVFMAAFGIGANVGFLLPYGRLQESEADRIGLVLMAKGGYDPRQAIPFWQRMSKGQSGNRSPEFLSTHPAPESRIKGIEAALPEAMRYYRPR